MAPYELDKKVAGPHPRAYRPRFELTFIYGLAVDPVASSLAVSLYETHYQKATIVRRAQSTASHGRIVVADPGLSNTFVDVLRAEFQDWV